jgi:hypothetical protein
MALAGLKYLFLTLLFTFLNSKHAMISDEEL